MRKALLKRKTKETEITVELNLDGKGRYDVKTSIPFMDHMLSLMTYHGRFDLNLVARGDVEVDFHHLIEDLGIVIGEAIKTALKEKEGIRRYGSAIVPMDESLSEVIIDLSGRPYLYYKVKSLRNRLRDIEASLFEDFFRALSNNALMNLHIILRHGRDLHHIFESIFKAFGRALRDATRVDPEFREVPSTKGRL